VIASDLWDFADATSFVTLRGLAAGVDVILKIEGFNPAGSIKMKTARELVRSAELSGRIHFGSELIESTSGSLGIRLLVEVALEDAAGATTDELAADFSSAPRAVEADKKISPGRSAASSQIPRLRESILIHSPIRRWHPIPRLFC